MELKLNRNVEQGDLVEWVNDGGSNIPCLVVYDEYNELTHWLLVSVRDLEVIDSYTTREHLESQCILIAKKNQLKLEEI